MLQVMAQEAQRALILMLLKQVALGFLAHKLPAYRPDLPGAADRCVLWCAHVEQGLLEGMLIVWRRARHKPTDRRFYRFIFSPLMDAALCSSSEL